MESLHASAICEVLIDSAIFPCRAIKESSIETDGMEKEFILGLMVQNLKVTLKMTRKKVLVHFSFQVAINLRFV